MAEATQQPSWVEDFSITYAVIVVASLIMADRIADFISYRIPRVGRIAKSLRVVVVENGKPPEVGWHQHHSAVVSVMVACADASFAGLPEG